MIPTQADFDAWTGCKERRAAVLGLAGVLLPWTVTMKEVEAGRLAGVEAVVDCLWNHEVRPVVMRVPGTLESFVWAMQAAGDTFKHSREGHPEFEDLIHLFPWMISDGWRQVFAGGRYVAISKRNPVFLQRLAYVGVTQRGGGFGVLYMPRSVFHFALCTPLVLPVDEPNAQVEGILGALGVPA